MSNQPDEPTEEIVRLPNTSRLDNILADAAPLGERIPRPQTARLSPPWRLLMQIGGQNQTTVGIEVKDKIILGRTDPVEGFYPDLDLTPYGAQTGGVSRRHAEIIQDSDNKALYLEDLGSTNGTRINGFALEARRRYRLRDGDEIDLGRVHITLRFVRSPYQNNP
jgi:pSer/pThr/pTyr-binding forkhead associated (FHA) protein